MKKWKSPILLASFLMAGMLTITVQAGDINGNEAGVISAASGTFEYEGKTYVADSQHIGQLQAKLSEDGVDLTAEQASDLIEQMYGSVGSGVTQGYLTQVGGGSDEPNTPETNPPETNPSGGGNQTDDGNSNNPNKPDNKETNKSGNDSSSTEDDKDGKGNKSSEKGADNNVEDSNSKSGKDSNKIESNKAGTAKDETGSSDKDNNDVILDDDNVYTRTSEEEQEYIDSLIKKAEERYGITEKEDSAKNNKENKGNSFSGFMAKNGSLIAIGIVVILIIAALIIVIRRMRRSALGAKLEVKDYIDIHTHILPGVDDGSSSIETTMDMVKTAYEEGIRKMIATPHYHIGHHHKSVEALKKIYETTRETIEEKYPDFELYLGNELFYSDGIIEKVEQGKALSLAGSRYILIEFRVDESYRTIYAGITGFLRARYIPVIAHVERYKNVMSDKKHLEELRSAGALLQMNLSSVKKHQKLVKEGLIDILGTDCHDNEHRAPETKEALQNLSTICTEEKIRELLVNTPELILKNKFK